jgi:hypothetical protein
VVIRRVGASAVIRPASTVCPCWGVTTAFIVFSPSTERSLHPEIKDDGNAAEKGNTFLKSDGLHGTPPAKNPPCQSLDKPNVAPSVAKSLENTWRIPGEFLKFLRQALRAERQVL